MCDVSDAARLRDGGGRSELTRYAQLHLAFHVAQAVETPSATSSSGFAEGGDGGDGGGGTDERKSQGHRRKSSGSVRSSLQVVLPLP